MAENIDIRGSLSFRTDIQDIKDNKNNIIFKQSDTFKTYTLKHYTFGMTSSTAINNTKQNEIFDNIPKIILSEFQPTRRFEWEKIIQTFGANLLQNLGKGGNSNIESNVMSDAAINSLGTVAGTALGAAYYSAIFAKYQKTPSAALDIPLQFVKGLFQGSWLGSYEMPFFSNVYLNANTNDGWSSSGSEKFLGDALQKVVQQYSPINFPTTPVWAKGNDSSPLNNLSFSFYLINDDDGDLINNFRFLTSFIAGCFWIQMDFIQQSPNVFDVEIPGRFHSYFCAVGAQLEYVGKVRKRENAKKGLNNFKGIQTALFPDAYKVTININDLCPNNFNNYIDYLLNGPVKASGQAYSGIDFGQTIAKNVTDVGKNILNKIIG